MNISFFVASYSAAEATLRKLLNECSDSSDSSKSLQQKMVESESDTESSDGNDITVLEKTLTNQQDKKLHTPRSETSKSGSQISVSGSQVSTTQHSLGKQILSYTYFFQTTGNY